MAAICFSSNKRPLPRSIASATILLLLLFCTQAAAETHYHEFVVEAMPVKRLCKTRTIITVNGMFPGPTLQVRNGDSLVINVVNRAKYNLTLHWHGIRQLRTAWADGPSFITQCPIRPGRSYTYRFTIEDQEGTLWWHAHSSWLRATVYGALVILPKLGSSYPFPTPQQEFPVIIGEWWNKNPLDVVRQALKTGGAPNISDAFTINGQPGDLYNCSSKGTVVFPVQTGQNVLLRVINAAMNTEHFFAIAGHRMTVVAADASYMKPFTTSFLMLGPGQTTDVLISADQPPARYYMAARAYSSARNQSFDNTTTTAILDYITDDHYHNLKQQPQKIPTPLLPRLPAYTDDNSANAFISSFKSPSPIMNLHDPVDLQLFFTVGLGLLRCPRGKRCQGPNGTRMAASMNNVSFVLPNKVSVLQAYLTRVPGVFTPNFPPYPPVQFDYTGNNIPRRLWQPIKGTEALKVKFGTTIQIVLQDTGIVTPENHPIHLHGYEFYVLATGNGNFNPEKDTSRFNLIDPPRRNTIAVPNNGWAVIRFVADNPGAWLMHCHIDIHLTWGLAMVFIVENGVGEMQTLQPPPADLPLC